MFQYRCGRCGNRVDRTARVCPYCEARLENIQCHNCGHSASRESFTNNRCPRCRAEVRVSKGRLDRCKECGNRMEPGQWTCSKCGHTEWVIIVSIMLAAVVCLALAAVVLPLPTFWTLLVGGLGVALFYSAFFGLGGALRWHAIGTVLVASLLLASFSLTALAARYRYSPAEMLIETPEAVAVAAAPTETPVPTAAPTAVPTPVLPTPIPEVIGTIQTGQLNIRSGPGMDFDILGGLYQDESIFILGRNGDATWLQMKTQTGITGWVFANLVSISIPVIDLPEVAGP